MTVFGYKYCAGHPAFVFQVVGQSRDDALAMVPGGKPSSPLVTNNTLIESLFESLCDFSAVANVFSVLLDDVHGRFFYIVLDRISLLLDFDCASSRGPAVVAGIGHVTKLRIDRNGQWRRRRHWPVATGTSHGRITQHSLHGMTIMRLYWNNPTHNGSGLCNGVVQSKAAG